jgi:hypothetical protein
VIIQHLTVRHGLVACTGCPAVLTNGKLAHTDTCLELGEHIARAAEVIARPGPWPLRGPERRGGGYQETG